MKKLLVGALALLSFSVMAESRKCALEHRKMSVGMTTKEYDLPDEVEGEFVSMKSDEFPELTFKARENSNRDILIALEIEGKLHFFVLGNERAILAYYPNGDNGDYRQRIDIACSLGTKIWDH